MNDSRADKHDHLKREKSRFADSYYNANRMTAKLIIKNFGPIQSIDINLEKYNILIGQQGAGKSTIAKVMCIIHSFDYTLSYASQDRRNTEILVRFLQYYNLQNYLRSDSYWFFEDELISFELNGTDVRIIYKKEFSNTPHQLESYYIPAERIALPMISESLFELVVEKSSLTEYFLQFGKDFIVARKNQKIFNLPMLNVEFEEHEGRNMVAINNNELVPLNETSSAVQALLPLLVILQYPVKVASVVVIEEPELHCFPLLQKQLLHYIVGRMKHPKLINTYTILPTHSPYLLSTINNLLLAPKVSLINYEEAAKIISPESWISKDEISAWRIAAGRAESLIDDSTGLIHENVLDEISEELADEFDALMNLYKPN